MSQQDDRYERLHEEFGVTPEEFQAWRSHAKLDDDTVSRIHAWLDQEGAAARVEREKREGQRRWYWLLILRIVQPICLIFFGYALGAGHHEVSTTVKQIAALAGIVAICAWGFEWQIRHRDD